MSHKDSIRIVLVGTQHPGNIGSAARAMKTMGLSNLILVAPLKYPDPEAFSLAASADDLLHSAKVVETLPEALQGCRLVIGTSARSRSIALPEFNPKQAALQLVEKSHDSPVALLFGRERTGLENHELQLCHGSVYIPCNPDYTSLNLAAAVQILCYEIRLQRMQTESEPSLLNQKMDTLPADFEQLERFFTHLGEFMDDVDFHKGKAPDVIMQRVRRLFLRAKMDEREIKILRGLLSDAQRALRLK